MKKNLFREHYENTTFNVPIIQRREIALQNWDTKGINNRHNYFESVDKLQKILASTTNVAGVFASTGYFLDPNETDTGKRGYLGHDLVIDIDKVLEGSRIDWLDDMCEITDNLVNVLITILGYARDDIILEFSGNKGFHLLIEGHKSLPVEDRRQIIEFLMGDKIDRRSLIPSLGGWGKVFAKACRTIAELCADDKESNEQILLSIGLPKVHAKKIGDLASSELVRNPLKQGRLDMFDAKTINAIRSWSIKSRKEAFSTIDKQVTIDKNRILRVAGSLHPKSGLVCLPLELSDLSDPQTIFEKLKVAGGTDEVELVLKEPALENFERMHRWEAGTYTVPRWLALHLSVQN
jgi:predicted DNA primase small subunit